MKKIVLMLALLVMLCSQQSFAQTAAKQSSVTDLLSLYYDIKDALVAGNAGTASAKAQAFVTSAKTSDVSPEKLEVLTKDADKISSNKNLKQQREYFIQLSNDMTSLVKTVKPAAPVYLQYCPMKDASWLSNEKDIKNPYYGSSMLTCGKVLKKIE